MESLRLKVSGLTVEVFTMLDLGFLFDPTCRLILEMGKAAKLQNDDTRLPIGPIVIPFGDYLIGFYI